MEKINVHSRQVRLQRLQRSNGGQVGIIMLLITVVMLTVGISAVSRSTSDVSISTTNEQTNKALDAAESGLEQAMSQTDLSGYAPGTVVVGDTKVTTLVTPKLTLQTSVDQGYTVGVNLKGNSSNSVKIEWGKETDCTKRAALVLSHATYWTTISTTVTGTDFATKCTTFFAADTTHEPTFWSAFVDAHSATQRAAVV